MLPTPSTSHVNYSHIYEPAEDSYLLLDTLASASETTFLRDRFPGRTAIPLVVEVGTGSGVVLAFAAANAQHIFGRSDVAALGLDVNSFACAATATTVKGALATEEVNSGCVFLDAVTGDLTSSLRDGEVDVLIFNPPYVPTESLPANPEADASGEELKASARFERDSHLLSLSYAGGADGMETTKRLLDQLPSILSTRGVAYILLCAQNKPETVSAQINTKWKRGWTAEKVADSGKKAGWEKLCVLRIWRKDA